MSTYVSGVPDPEKRLMSDEPSPLDSLMEDARDRASGGSLSETPEPTVRLTRENPWPGLASFTEDGQAFFHGRDQERDELLRNVRRSRLTVLYGVSGLGKTSLIRAGLFPRLREEGYIPVYVHLRYNKFPDNNAAPKTALVDQIRDTVLAECESWGVTVDRGGQAMEGRETLWEFFQHRDTCFWNDRHQLVRPAVVVDQFEEVFTLGKEVADQVEILLDELSCLIETRPPADVQKRLDESGGASSFNFSGDNLKLILSFRADYLSRVTSLQRIAPSIYRTHQELFPMKGHKALEVVRKSGGDLLDEQVAEQIVRFVGGDVDGNCDLSSLSIEPALLSLVCFELNDARQAKGASKIDLDTLRKGKDRIFVDFYESCLENMPAGVRQFIEKDLLTRDGHRCPKADTEFIQAVADKTGEEDARNYLKILENRRLLHADMHHGYRMLELAHDVLCPVVRRQGEVRRAETLRQEEARKSEILRHNEARARRRFYASMAGMAVLVCVIAVASFACYWCFFKSHTKYYASVTRQDGIMVGLGPIDEDKVGFRTVSFKFVYERLFDRKLKRKPVTTVVAVNHCNVPTTNHGERTYLWYDREIPSEDTPLVEEPATINLVSMEDLASVCQWDFFSDDNGNVIYEKGRDRRDKVIWVLVYAPLTGEKDDGEINELEGHTRSAHYVGASGYPQRQREDAAEYVRIHYDAKGYETLIEYCNASGDVVTGFFGACAQEKKYDEQGRMTSLASLKLRNEQNPPRVPTRDDYEYMIDSAGNTGLRYSYDEKGNLKEIVSFGLAGETVPIIGGPAIFRYEYDDYDNTICETYFKEDGRTPGYEASVHRIEYELEFAKGYTEATYHGADGPCVNNEGYHGYRMEMDSSGNTVKWYAFDVESKPVPQPNGHVMEKWKYDQYGNVLENAYFDSNDLPMLSREGNIHKVVREYDEPGRLLLNERYTDVQGQPCLCQGGYHGIDYIYDERGRLWKSRYVGLDGNLVTTSFGYAMSRNEYDTHNYVTCVAYLDEQEHLIVNDDFSNMRSKYDLHGFVVEETYYDSEDRPFIYSRVGAHKIKYARTAEGKLLQIRFYDETGKPMRARGGKYPGSTSMRYGYDDDGRVIWRRNYGAEWEAAENDEGIHWETLKYDDHGHRIERAARNLQGQLVPFEDDRVALRRWKYDENGKETEVANFGSDEKAVCSKDAYATIRYKFDDKGRQIEEAYFGIDDKPATCKEGYQRVATKYDDTGMAVEQCFAGYDFSLYGYDKLVVSHNGSQRKAVAMTDGGDVVEQRAVVIGVRPNSQADEAGIQSGDVLLRYDGQPVADLVALKAALGSAQTGKDQAALTGAGRGNRELELLRNGQVVRVQVKPGEVGITMQSIARSAAEDPARTGQLMQRLAD